MNLIDLNLLAAAWQADLPSFILSSLIG